MSKKQYVKAAITHAGGVSSVAKVLKLKSLTSVYKWIDKNRIPPNRMIDFCKLLPVRQRSKYPPHRLNPDAYAPPKQKRTA